MFLNYVKCVGVTYSMHEPGSFTPLCLLPVKKGNKASIYAIKYKLMIS